MASAEALFSRHSSSSGDKGSRSETNSDPSSTSHRQTGQTSSRDVQATIGHVAYIGEDVEAIPRDLIRKHSTVAKILDLSYNKLNTLDGLEEFSKLEELVLDNNQLNDESMAKFPKLTHLHTLTLNKNLITDTDSLLETLTKKCPSLRYLSLLGNKACPNELLGDDHDDEDYQRYRYYVLFKFPRLSFLDSRSVTSEERAEAKRVGQFMRIIKPAQTTFEDSGKRKKPLEDNLGYTPLPASSDSAGQHRGVFGQCKYVYYGKHSEGNRFIRNSQL